MYVYIDKMYIYKQIICICKLNSMYIYIYNIFIQNSRWFLGISTPSTFFPTGCFSGFVQNL